MVTRFFELSVFHLNCIGYTYACIHTTLYNAKNRENESEALAQDD